MATSKKKPSAAQLAARAKFAAAARAGTLGKKRKAAKKKAAAVKKAPARKVARKTTAKRAAPRQTDVRVAKQKGYAVMCAGKLLAVFPALTGAKEYAQAYADAHGKSVSISST